MEMLKPMYRITMEFSVETKVEPVQEQRKTRK